MDATEGPGAGSARPGAAGGFKTFRCGDVVPGCEQQFRGTEAEVLDAAAAHGARDHGIEMTAELVDAVRGALRPG